MSTLVTGATGYIGHRLALALADREWPVRILCRSKPDDQLTSRKTVTIYRGDITNRKEVDHAMEGVRQVYHLAAYARLWSEDPGKFFEVNVGGAVNVMESAMEHGIDKMVFTSTGGVFGPSEGEPIGEDHVRKHPFFNRYEESKFIAEKKIKDYVLKGLDAVIVNPTRVYGPGLLTKSNAVTYLISQYLEGKWRIIPGNGQTVANYTYIGDVVEGHILAMEKGAPGERYILGGENLSYNELFDHIKALSGKNHRMINIPYPLIKIFSGFEMVRAKIANRDPLVTPAAVAAMKFDTARTVEKAKNELGYSVTEIGEGIDRTIEWIRKEYEQNSG